LYVFHARASPPLRGERRAVNKMSRVVPARPGGIEQAQPLLYRNRRGPVDSRMVDASLSRNVGDRFVRSRLDK
jgi:hypothetical protein